VLLTVRHAMPCHAAGMPPGPAQRKIRRASAAEDPQGGETTLVTPSHPCLCPRPDAGGFAP